MAEGNGTSTLVISVDQDRRARALARLDAFRQALEGRSYPSLDAVEMRDYDESLAHLEACGFDVEEFRVPPDAWYWSQANRNVPMLQAPYVLMKVRSVLGYFTFVTDVDIPSEPKPRATIGFEAPKRS